MEVINLVKKAVQPATAPSAPPAVQPQSGGGFYGVRTLEVPEGQSPQSPNEALRNDQRKKPTDLTENQAAKMTDEMNQFMAKLNTDIQFTVHEKTNRLMLQVVDKKNGEVLKEIPSQEMLDLIARISDYVGVLLDKKA